MLDCFFIIPISGIKKKKIEPSTIKMFEQIKEYNIIFKLIFWNFVFKVLALQRPVDIKNRPRIPIPDEDPYSIAGVSSSSGPSELREMTRSEIRHEQIYGQSSSYHPRRGEKPPKLPPRENIYGHHDIIPKVLFINWKDKQLKYIYSIKKVKEKRD